MATITTTTENFPKELVTDVFSKVKGHSSLAKLANQTPVPFAGATQFVFSMDGEAAIVGEGAKKPAGDAAFTAVSITPIKFVYQHRLTDEFVSLAEEQQLPYLQAFTDGFATKMARALDIAAMHGVNPATGTTVDSLASKNFDMSAVGKIETTAGAEDDDIDSAVQAIVAAGGTVTGLAMAPAFGASLAKIKVNGVVQYPEFRFGQNPAAFYGMTSDVNNTVSFGTSDDLAIIGDFQNAFRWGYAEDVPCEVIQYGDPDGLGDLKQQNQIVLRAEAYLGWGILDASYFKKIVKKAG
ncbi:MAG: phage major capsid protein [Lactimicrobium massiliense]|nr:phage major capsid protein [Lactimicrobium massiliense]MDD6230413.1 phage major capsid protein [Lactimicrobium massiliense]MDD6458190.1 phage major capsid protein [Lactimicrobium massiliense]MDD6560971.1 phage major capsid protein [Lactimicrobium massiliense]